MDYLIEIFGLDTLLAIVVFVGSVIRAGQGEKVPALSGLIAAFTPFFVVMCLLYLLEWFCSWVHLEVPGKPMLAFGGLFAYLGNSWLLGLVKNGKSIEEEGALQSLFSLVKSLVNFKKAS